MRKRKSKRGRKVGQAKRLTLDPKMDRLEQLLLAQDGGYSHGVVTVLGGLQSAVEARKYVEREEIKTLGHILKNYAGMLTEWSPPSLPKEHCERTESWQPAWRRSRACMEWIRVLSSLDRSVQILLSAVEKRDAQFFRDVAKRLESDANKKQHAEPAISALMHERLFMGPRRTLKDCPKVSDAQKFLRARGVKYDDRTVRDLLKATGYTLQPKGRPKKPGTV